MLAYGNAISMFPYLLSWSRVVDAGEEVFRVDARWAPTGAASDQWFVLVLP